MERFDQYGFTFVQFSSNQDQDIFGCLGVGSKPWGDLISMASFLYRLHPNQDRDIFCCLGFISSKPWGDS